MQMHMQAAWHARLASACTKELKTNLLSCMLVAPGVCGLEPLVYETLSCMLVAAAAGAASGREAATRAATLGQALLPPRAGVSLLLYLCLLHPAPASASSTRACLCLACQPVANMLLKRHSEEVAGWSEQV